MGLLDEAIRDHLDLKRRNGADPAEIERLEREALGPVRRGSASVDEPSFADGPSGVDAAYDEAPHGDQGYDESDRGTQILSPDADADFGGPVGDLDLEPFDDEPLDLGHEEHDSPKSHRRRRFGLFGRRRDEEDEYEDEDEYDDQDFEGEPADAGHFESEPAADVFDQPVAEQPHASEPHDFVAADDEFGQPLTSAAGHEPAAADSYPEPAPEPPAASSVEPNLGTSRPAEASPEQRAAASGLPRRPHFIDLPPAEPDAAPEPDVAPEPAEPTQGGPQADPDATREYHVADAEPVPADEDAAGAAAPQDDIERALDDLRDQRHGEPAAPATEEPPPSASARTPIWHQRDREEPAQPTASDDPLEGTPDFLQDTPDHDRLWFEQKPPKDFDFGG